MAMGRPGSFSFNSIHLVGSLTHVEFDLHPAPETNYGEAALRALAIALAFLVNLDLVMVNG